MLFYFPRVRWSSNRLLRKSSCRHVVVARETVQLSRGGADNQLSSWRRWCTEGWLHWFTLSARVPPPSRFTVFFVCSRWHLVLPLCVLASSRGVSSLCLFISISRDTANILHKGVRLSCTCMCMCVVCVCVSPVACRPSPSSLRRPPPPPASSSLDVVHRLVGAWTSCRFFFICLPSLDFSISCARGPRPLNAEMCECCCLCEREEGDGACACMQAQGVDHAWGKGLASACVRGGPEWSC